MNRQHCIFPNTFVAVLALTLSVSSLAHAMVAENDHDAAETREHRVRTRVETPSSPDAENATPRVVFEYNYSKTRVQTPDESPRPNIRIDEDGFALESADGQFEFGMSPYVQLAYRLDFSDLDGGQPNGFTLEKFRPSIEGRYADFLEYKFTIDIRINSIAMHNAHVTLRAHPRFSMRVGLQKWRFGVEQRQSSKNGLFLSRAMPSAIGGSRDLGLALDARPHDSLRLELGVYNGAYDRRVPQRVSHGSAAMQAGARWTLVGGDDATSESPGYLVVGGSVVLQRIEGDETAPHLSERKSIGDRTIIGYAPGVFANGRKFASTAFLYGGYRGLYFHGEFVTSNQQIQHEDAQSRFVEQAWSAAVSYAFGGMHGWSGVVPNHSVLDGGLGALRLAFRMHGQNISTPGDAWIVTTSGSAQTSTSALGWSVGAAWQLSRRMRLQADYDQITFESRPLMTRGGTEHILRFGLTAGN